MLSRRKLVQLLGSAMVGQLVVPETALAREVDMASFDGLGKSGKYPQQDFQRFADYFAFYHFDLPTDSSHYFGIFEYEGLDIHIQSFVPKKPKKSIMNFHGFLDHTGISGSWISEMVRRDYAVYCFDLPGHGLSSGKRSFISDFSIYQKVLDAILAALPPIDFAVGHSTGGAIIAEYLLRNKCFTKSVLVAPLLRIHLGGLIRLASIVFPRQISVPNFSNKRTSNPDFFALRRQDPLRPGLISNQWLRAAHAWRIKMEKASQSDCDMLILQGSADIVVDHKYNIPVYGRLFPNSECLMYDGAKHHLINERDPWRSEARKAVFDYLER